MTWTPERRAAQAARCRAHRPWEHSTGPRTPDGKARAARNARKHGLRSAEGQAVRHILRMQARFVRALVCCDPSYTATEARAAHFATLALPALWAHMQDITKRTEEARRKKPIKTRKRKRVLRKNLQSD